MRCRDCPYGEEDFKRRMYWYEKTISEIGIPNDIYHNLKPEDATAEFEQYIWCDKLGGKVFWFGRCSDAYSEPLIQTRHVTQKKKRRNKRERDLKHKKHLERMWKARGNYWSPPVLYVDYLWRNHKMIDVNKPYYKKLTPNHGGKYQRFYKKISNKKVRRYKDEISKGSNYKKVFDYWWTIS